MRVCQSGCETFPIYAALAGSREVCRECCGVWNVPGEDAGGDMALGEGFDGCCSSGDVCDEFEG